MVLNSVISNASLIHSTILKRNVEIMKVNCWVFGEVMAFPMTQYVKNVSKPIYRARQWHSAEMEHSEAEHVAARSAQCRCPPRTRREPVHHLQLAEGESKSQNRDPTGHALHLSFMEEKSK